MEELDLETRICLYIMNVEQVLDKVRTSLDTDPRVREIISIVEAYVKDAKYYLSRRDYFTALSTITYAEGLLDALRFLNILSFEWKRPSELVERARTKVLTAGTFEIIHPGHIYYLRQAWRLGRVVTIVSRDSTVRKIKKRDPIVDEKSRLEVVGSLYYVHKARLGYEDDMLRVVEEERPNIILLGPDQPVDEDWLKRELEKRGLGNIEVLRLREDLDKSVYSTSMIIRRIVEKYVIQR
ncbi:MAG: cytidylyltransferase family protein [Crenarchaeota archaeon]|nr:cytidylyltransferase family protein [Thermoproteota archaeon]